MGIVLMILVGVLVVGINFALRGTKPYDEGPDADFKLWDMDND